MRVDLRDRHVSRLSPACGMSYVHGEEGNPGPDNVIAGVLLGWAFLKSGSLLAPIIFHALGNVLAVGVQLRNWYWIQHGLPMP